MLMTDENVHSHKIIPMSGYGGVLLVDYSTAELKMVQGMFKRIY
jgi:hypothetical protein